MKKIYFIFLVILSIFQSNAQTKSTLTNYQVRIFPDAFLIGTFQDYNGRFSNIDKDTQIDRYYPYEKSLAIYISYFITQNYKVKNELEIKDSYHRELYIPNLAKRLNYDFYSENGEFNITKLISEEEKLSYLLGVYYRNGNLLDENIYGIKLANSPKHKVIYQLLKDLGSDKIVYKEITDKIPKSYTFYFVATPKMIKYFNTLNQEKIQLEFDRISSFSLSESSENKTTKEIEKQKKELVKSLKIVWKLP